MQRSVVRNQSSFFLKLYSYNSSFGTSAKLSDKINSLNNQIQSKNDEFDSILDNKKTMEKQISDLKNQNEEFKIITSQMKSIEQQN